VIIFDFDGVLIDSVSETCITAYNAATGELKTSAKELPEGYLEVFLNNRYHVQPAGDFLPFTKWCIENRKNSSLTLSRSEFQKIVATNSDKSLTDRTELFFEARERFVQQDPQYWVSLHRPYEPLWSRLQNSDPTSIVLLTNKNKNAVIKITSHFGVKLAAENIYSGDKGVTKIQNLRSITERFATSPYAFLDDSYYNLIELKNSTPDNVPFLWYLATWGYVGPNDANLALAEGITPLTQDELIKHLG